MHFFLFYTPYCSVSRMCWISKNVSKMLNNKNNKFINKYSRVCRAWWNCSMHSQCKFKINYFIHLYLSSILSPAIPSPPPVLGDVMGRGLVGGLGPLPILYFASNSLMVSLTRDLGRGGGFKGLFSFRGSEPTPTFLNNKIYKYYK